MSDEKKSFWTKTTIYTDNRGNQRKETEPNVANIIKFSVGMVLLVILVIALWPFKIVGPTERGVVKTFGEVGNEIIEPGLRFRLPIAQVIDTYDLTPQTVAVNIPVGEDGALSRDRQTIGIKGSFNWRYDEDSIVDIARRFSSINTLTRQTNDIINTAIRNTVGRYDIANIVTDQATISSLARESAQTELRRANIPVEITVLNLNNWDWSDEYDQMIQRTITMQQDALRAEAELVKIEQEAQQEVLRAEASARALEAAATGRLRAAELDARSAIAKAEGERDAEIARATGRNESNRLINQNLNVEVRLRELEIQMVRAEKLAPGVEVPQYIPLNPTGGVVTLPGR